MCKPCSGYTEERLAQLWDGKDGLSLREINSLNIRPRDRLWVLPRLAGPSVVVEWMIYCVYEARVIAEESGLSSSYAVYGEALQQVLDAKRLTARGKDWLKGRPLFATRTKALDCFAAVSLLAEDLAANIAMQFVEYLPELYIQDSKFVQTINKFMNKLVEMEEGG